MVGRLAAITCATAFCILAAYPAAAQATKEANGRQIAIDFPGQDRLGELWELSPNSSIGAKSLKTVRGVEARGRVRLTVHNPVVFAPNYKAVESGILSQAFDGGAIDGLQARKLPFDDKRLACLKNFPNLQRLDLGASDVSDKGLPLVGALKKMVFLFMSRSLVTAAGLPHLTGLNHLTTLHLSYTPLGGGSLAALASLPALVEVELDRCQLTDSQINSLLGVKHLRILKVSFNKGITDVSIGHILKFKELQKLDLTDTSVSIGGLKRLKQMRLQRLDIRFFRYADGEIAELREYLRPTELVNGGVSKKVPSELFAPLH